LPFKLDQVIKKLYKQVPILIHVETNQTMCAHVCVCVRVSACVGVCVSVSFMCVFECECKN